MPRSKPCELTNRHSRFHPCTGCHDPPCKQAGEILSDCKALVSTQIKSAFAKVGFETLATALLTCADTGLEMPQQNAPPFGCCQMSDLLLS